MTNNCTTKPGVDTNTKMCVLSSQFCVCVCVSTSLWVCVGVCVCFYTSCLKVQKMSTITASKLLIHPENITPCNTFQSWNHHNYIRKIRFLLGNRIFSELFPFYCRIIVLLYFVFVSVCISFFFFLNPYLSWLSITSATWSEVLWFHGSFMSDVCKSKVSKKNWKKKVQLICI